VTGTLGVLGPAQPIVSSFVISNSGETLVYLSSGPLTCPQIMVSRWLGSATPGSQVVELVIKGPPMSGPFNVAPLEGEVNYAAGGRTSAYEKVAQSGTITFIAAQTTGPVEGTFAATYNDGNSIMGTFNAEFCTGGQSY
jgi:hypothetical protein